MGDITYLIQHYGLIVVFLSTLVEQLGVPLPSYPVLLVAGALSLSGGDPILPIVIVATLGAVIGDLVCYAVGSRYGHYALALVCKFSLSRDSCVRRTEASFARWGPWALLFAKFTPGLGLVLVMLCGATRVAVPLFILMDGIGACAYVALPIVLGYLFHEAIDAVLTTLTRWGEYGAAAVFGALAAYLALRWINRQMFIRRLRDGMIPGAVAADVAEIPSFAKDYPHDAEIVVYCSCPNEASAATAALHLKRAGFTRIRPLSGGIEAWASAGRPIERAERANQ